jgi:hypothetical protein
VVFILEIQQIMLGQSIVTHNEQMQVILVITACMQYLIQIVK